MKLNMRLYIATILFLLSCSLYSQTAKIASLGPEGGIVSILKGLPDESVLIAVIQEHYVYRSTDGGENWQSIEIPAPAAGIAGQNTEQFIIYDISFHPGGDTVLMATSFGFFKSVDAGEGWIHVQTFPFPKYCVKYTPSNPTIIFGSDEAGVLRSTDGGETWLPLKDNVYFGNIAIRRIAIHPSDNDINKIRLVATTAFNDSNGIFLTTDGGATWQPFDNGLPSGDARKIYAVEIDSTGLGKKDYRVVIGTADGMYGLQTDQLSGLWQRIRNEDIGVNISGIISCGQMVYDKFDATSLPPQHRYKFYFASNASVYDSEPKENSSTSGVFSIGSELNTIIAIPFSPKPKFEPVFKQLCNIQSIFVPVMKDKNKIFLGTSTGIFASTDGGQSWNSKNHGISHTIIRNVVSMTHPDRNSSLFAGVFGGGVYRSDDEGATWVSSNTGLTNPYVTSISENDKRKSLFAGTAYSLYRSEDGGKNWNQIFNITPDIIKDSSRFTTRANDFITRSSPKNPDILMTSSPAYGLHISKDGGQTWFQPTLPNGFDTIYIPENIEFDPVDSLTIYYSGSGLLKSTDLGQNWIDISSSIPRSMFVPALNKSVNIQTLSPAINSKNNQEIFLASVYDMSEGFPLGLWKTTNGGNSWTFLNPPLSVYDVQYDQVDEHRLIASGPGGIFFTTNAGSSWSALNDSTNAARYFLLSDNQVNPNIFYVGSEAGAYKVEINDLSHLTIDTLNYNFGDLQIGNDTVRTIYFKNTTGQRNVLLHYRGISDSTSFNFLGTEEINIPAGSEAQIEIKFEPQSGGWKIGVLKFFTSDLLLDTVRIVLIGHAFERKAIEKFTYEFGSVTVGKDSIINIEIDNLFGQEFVTLAYQGNSDSTSFSYNGANVVNIDTGQIGILPVRFSPKTVGSMQSYMNFATTNPRYPRIVLRLQGKGIARNFVSRRILIDTLVGFSSATGYSVDKYFKLLTMSLDRADIKVDYTMDLPASSYNAMVYVLPNGAPPQSIIDTLQSYIVNGGTVVLLGDYGERNVLPFNTFLDDSVWSKYDVKTGIRFNTDRLVDESISDTSLMGISHAFPVSRNAITYNVDSLILFSSGSVSIDSSVSNAIPLFLAKSPGLASVSSIDSSITNISEKLVAAATTVKKGKIIAIADYDIWWDGLPEDTTKPFGIFGGKNLRLALNIFGLIDNLAAQLPEQTPKEAYKLFSIPYSFEDSSVLALFKDLGIPNEYIWRMFGRWNDKRGYAEFPKDFKNIRRGDGYWLITKEPKEINFGTASVQGSEGDFEITLQPGYNMIGNPFPYRVSWAESFREDSVERILWKYDQEFDTTSMYMEPFEGYFVKNQGSLPKTIRISSLQVSTASTSVPKSQNLSYSFSPNEWKIQLVAQTTHAEDAQNYIGMLSSSSNGIDKEDFSEPPSAPSDYVSLNIKNNKERLAADYRSISAEGQYWDIEILSSKPKVPVTLSLNKFGNISSSFKLFLLDKTEERMIDVTTSLNHLFTLGKKEYSRQFRLIAGTQSYIENNTNGIPLVPMEYALEQNFPNPFNPTTSIRYTLSHTANVKLEIFNILGQSVRSLVNQVQPIGVYTVLWDGTDDLKKKVASGFYYYRLQANEFTNVKKMTLIK